MRTIRPEAVCRHPRNLTDELIRKMAQRGCVIGINYGSDFDGIDEPLEIGSPDQVPLLAEALEREGFTGSEREIFTLQGP